MPLRLLMAGFYAALIVVPPGGATSGRTDPTYGMAPATPIANGERGGNPPFGYEAPRMGPRPPTRAAPRLHLSMPGRMEIASRRSIAP